MARAIVLPASGGVSGARLRKINEELWLARIVPDARAERRGLLNLKATDDQLAAHREGRFRRRGAQAVREGGRLERRHAADRRRQAGPGGDGDGHPAPRAGRELKLVDEKAHRFLWVTEFPLFEWDKDANRWSSLHHPFTSPIDADLPLLASDPGKVRAKAYDIVLNGYEVGGGSIRIHDSALQAKVFELLALSPRKRRSASASSSRRSRTARRRTAGSRSGSTAW